MLPRALRLILALLALALLAQPAAARPGSAPGPAQAPAITILSPNSSTVISDETLFIDVRVTSTFEIARVIAAVGTRTTTLTCCSQNNTHTGRINLSGLPRGQYTLTVTATNALGGTGQAQAGFSLDRPPTLSVDAPQAGSILYDNKIAVRVSCADDDPAGCQNVTMFNRSCGPNQTILASGTSALSQTVSIGQSGGAFSFSNICLQGTDSAGQNTAEILRRVYYNLPAYFVRELDTPGKILDADATRLVVERADPPSLVIVDRATRAETTVATGEFFDARLVPGGALYIQRQPSTLRLYQWYDGVETSLGEGVSGLVVNGNYAIWSQGSQLYRHDLLARTTVLVGNNAKLYDYELLPNGDVIYFASGDAIVRYSGGVNTTLIEYGNDGFDRQNLASDGTTLIYTRCANEFGPRETYCRIVELKNGQEVVISLIPEKERDRYRYYDVTNGWVAYTKLGNAGANQIWRRAPDGTEERVSFLNGTNLVDELGPDGSLIWNNFFWISVNQLVSSGYLSRPGQQPLAVNGRGYLNPSVGFGLAPIRFYNRGEIWEAGLEGSLFRIEGIMSEQQYLPSLAR